MRATKSRRSPRFSSASKPSPPADRHVSGASRWRRFGQSAAGRQKFHMAIDLELDRKIPFFSLKPTSHSTEFHGTHRALLKIAAFAHSDSCAEHDRRPSSGMTRCGAADNNEGWPIARGTRPKTDAVN